MPSGSHAPAQVRLRFYAELNDFLRPEQSGKWLVHAFWLPPSVKDAIEAMGIPHTEVDLILRNGESVDFTTLLQDGDEISVFPVFETLGISPVLKVRPQPLRLIRFVVDVNPGRLATLLRLVGFDTLYRNDYGDAELADISVNEHRILLSAGPRAAQTPLPYPRLLPAQHPTRHGNYLKSCSVLIFAPLSSRSAAVCAAMAT